MQDRDEKLPYEFLQRLSLENDHVSTIGIGESSVNFFAKVLDLLE
jgi:hypothetical protein